MLVFLQIINKRYFAELKRRIADLEDGTAKLVEHELIEV